MKRTIEQLDLNNSSKLEALLHQFIKLYDKLSVEQALMLEREHKLLKNLEKISNTIDDLNKLNLKIKEETHAAVKEVSAAYFLQLTNELEEFFQHNAKDFFHNLKISANQVKAIVEEFQKIRIELFLAIFMIGGLIGGMLVFFLA